MTTENANAIEAWNTVLFDKFVEYRDVVIRGLSHHGNRLLERFPPPRGGRVLDVGCGFGDTTRQIAALVGPNGRAVGVDAASRFIEAAREEAKSSGVANADFFVADVQLEDLRGPYDFAVSRFGTMFFLSAVAALRNVHRHLKPGGRLAMVVWRKREDNAWLYDSQLAVRAIIPEEEEAKDEVTCGPGPFSMANADLLTSQLLAAGFENIVLERYDTDIRVGSTIDEVVKIAMDLGPAGEIVRLAGERGERKKPEIVAALREVSSKYMRPDGAFAPSSTWLVSATRSA
jgi:ubiquinone/menaquinone biosynthesis C-methylase UbiE